MELYFTEQILIVLEKLGKSKDCRFIYNKFELIQLLSLFLSFNQEQLDGSMKIFLENHFLNLKFAILQLRMEI